MENSKRVKWVYGNRLLLCIPMQLVTMTSNGKKVEDYTPKPGDVVRVVLDGDETHVFTPTIDGSVLLVEDNGTLPIGVYDVSILVTERDGTKRRSKWERVVEICNSNHDLTRSWGQCRCACGSMIDATVRRLKWVQGNMLHLAIPMLLVTVTGDGRELSEYCPTAGSTVKVVLSGDIRYEFTPTIDGNILHLDDNGTIAAGTYDVTILVTEFDGTKRRSRWERVIEVHDASHRVMEMFNDFPEQGATVEASFFPFTDSAVIKCGVFFFARGTGDYNELSNLPDLSVFVENSTFDSALIGKADKSDIPTRTSQLQNDSGYTTEQWVTSQGYMTSFTETDPTVPAWAKNPTKPQYTASEVGALPASTTIPTKTSQLQNDSGFLTQHQSLSGYATEQWIESQGYLTSESDPTVPSWAKAPSKPTYTAQEVGALPSDTTIPTKTSDLTNDRGFLTQSDLSAYHTVEDFEDFYNHPFDALRDNVENHIGSSTIHVTQANKDAWNGKQDTLVSGESIKTINNESILGEGNISTSSVIFRQW